MPGASYTLKKKKKKVTEQDVTIILLLHNVFSLNIPISRARITLLRRIGWVDSVISTAFWEHKVPFSYKGSTVTASRWLECLPEKSA